MFRRSSAGCKSRRSLLASGGYVNRLTRSSVRLVIVVLLSAGAWAQSFGGRIIGAVVDASRATIPNSVVTILNEGTGVERRLVADSRGLYVASELPVGYYTVRFDAPGFGRAERL